MAKCCEHFYVENKGVSVVPYCMAIVSRTNINSKDLIRHCNCDGKRNHCDFLRTIGKESHKNP